MLVYQVKIQQPSFAMDIMINSLIFQDGNLAMDPLLQLLKVIECTEEVLLMMAMLPMLQ
jgi:hypothetical protein